VLSGRFIFTVSMLTFTKGVKVFQAALSIYSKGGFRMATRNSQIEHDRMVDYVAKLLIGKKHQDVRADLPGFTQPRRIVWQSTGEGSVPDVTSQDEEFRIFEVETRDSIHDEHTETQWKLFASYAKANDAMFYIVFPKGASAEVKQRLNELGLEAYLMEV
jgi:hypothetical protein